jgi:ABC-type branched-subunit amino acid transport system substrate-binding protein
MNARSVLIAVTTTWLAASTSMVDTAFADHRPGNVVVMGGTMSQSGRYAEPAGRQMNAVKLYVEELNARGRAAAC